MVISRLQVPATSHSCPWFLPAGNLFSDLWNVLIAPSFELAGSLITFSGLELYTPYSKSNWLHGFKTISVLYKFQRQIKCRPVHGITHFTFHCQTDLPCILTYALISACSFMVISWCEAWKLYLKLVKGLGQECKVELLLGSYISCYICFTKLNFSLIIKLDVLRCLDILFWPRDMSCDHFVKTW